MAKEIDSATDALEKLLRKSLKFSFSSSGSAVSIPAIEKAAVAAVKKFHEHYFKAVRFRARCRRDKKDPTLLHITVSGK